MYKSNSLEKIESPVPLCKRDVKIHYPVPEISIKNESIKT